jgi:hypothetical protein
MASRDRPALHCAVALHEAQLASMGARGHCAHIPGQLRVLDHGWLEDIQADGAGCVLEVACKLFSPAHEILEQCLQFDRQSRCGLAGYLDHQGAACPSTRQPQTRSSRLLLFLIRPVPWTRSCQTRLCPSLRVRTCLQVRRILPPSVRVRTGLRRPRHLLTDPQVRSLREQNWYAMSLILNFFS